VPSSRSIPATCCFPERTRTVFAIAERSVLADSVKDSGAVSLFPQLASQWKDQVQAQRGWENFRLADFENLAGQYPVTWILTRSPGPNGLTCPYQDRGLVVCRITAGATHLAIGR
jgi:hypothetical protein